MLPGEPHIPNVAPARVIFPSVLHVKSYMRIISGKIAHVCQKAQDHPPDLIKFEFSKMSVKI